MSFQFAFPTLKNLSMIRICQAVLENRTRRMLQYYRYLDTLDEEEDMDDEGIEVEDIEVNDHKKLYAHDFVSNLDLIPQLRHDLADVFRGMQQQTHNLINKFSHVEKAEDVALIFDVYGRLDVAAVWRCYFENQLNNVESLEPALDLLECALEMHIWGGIEAIFAKIMSLFGLDPDSFPKPEVIWNDEHVMYMLSYDLEALLDEQSANLGSRLTNIFWDQDFDFEHDDRYLLIPLDKLCENYVFMQEFFITMDKVEKEDFFKQIVSWLYIPSDLANFVSDIITDLDNGMQRYLMVKISKDQIRNSAGFARDILCNMLCWPFTEFFMLLLELSAPVLTTYDYAKLFCDICEQVSDQGGFGNLYSNLLLRFCLAIPLDVKQEFSQRYVKTMIKESLQCLRHVNSQLCDTIVKVLSPQIK